MIRDMLEDWPGRVVLLSFILLIALIPIMVWATIADQQEWNAFKSAHACKIVGKMRGDVTTTVAPIIGGNGGIAVGTSVSPDKTGWQCDDGVTYWR